MATRSAAASYREITGRENARGGSRRATGRIIRRAFIPRGYRAHVRAKLMSRSQFADSPNSRGGCFSYHYQRAHGAPLSILLARLTPNDVSARSRGYGISPPGSCTRESTNSLSYTSRVLHTIKVLFRGVSKTRERASQLMETIIRPIHCFLSAGS